MPIRNPRFPRPLLLLPVSLCAVSVALPVRAQLLPRPSVPSTVAPLSFDDIFADLNAPLTYKIKDLKGEWRLCSLIRTVTGGLGYGCCRARPCR